MAYVIGDDIFRFPRYSAELERDLCRASTDEIHEIQSRRLRLVLAYCWDNMPFYRRLWETAGVSPTDVHNSEDLVKLPTWDKDVQRAEIAAHPPYGSYYVDTHVRRISHLLSSGGTTGVPRIFPILRSDIPGLQDIETRSMQFIGVGEDDVVQVCSHYSAFAGAWCSTWAVEGTGAALVPAGSGKSLETPRQVDLINRMGVTVLRGQPGYIERLAKVTREMGLDPASLKVRTIMTGGEAFSPERRKRIEQDWNAKIHDFFGSADTFSWTSVDCAHSQGLLGEPGMHIWEDSCVVEVLDEEQKPCSPGHFGELTLTTFNWRNSPRIRYRTGDLVAVYREQCGCGRNLARMSSVRGRVDHVVRIKGVNIYPSAVDSIITGADNRIREFFAVARRENDRDMLAIVLEWPDQTDTEIVKKVAAAASHGLGTAAQIELVQMGTTAHRTGVEGSLHKPQRLFDDRNK